MKTQEEQPEKSNSNILVALLALLGLGGIATFFILKKKPSIDPVKLIDYRQRSSPQKLRTAESIQELYLAHGQKINGDLLIQKTQEFFDLERNMHSNLALKQIETTLSATSSKGLVYGKNHGLYGFDELLLQ